MDYKEPIRFVTLESNKVVYDTNDLDESVAMEYAPVRYSIINTITKQKTVYYLDELKQILDGKRFLSKTEKHIISMCCIKEAYDKGLKNLEKTKLITICNRNEAKSSQRFKQEI